MDRLVNPEIIKLCVFMLYLEYMIQKPEDESEKINDWRNEHGEPDFAYLQSLVTEGSIESLNKLRAIADDMNVSYNFSNTMDELMDMISLAVKNNGDMYDM